MIVFGEWTSEGVVKEIFLFRVFHNVRHTLVVWDMQVSCKGIGSFL